MPKPYKTVAVGLIKQILLGVGISAGEAIVETGQQITISALQTKLQEWGVNIDPSSPLGLLIDNFKSNLGSRLSNEIMMSSSMLLGSAIESLEGQYLEQRGRVYNEVVSNAGSFRNSFMGAFNLFRGKWGASSVDLYLGQQMDAYDKGALEDKQKAITNLYAMRNVVSNHAGAWGQTMGTNNSAYSAMTNFTDDTKFFDAVQYLINMKKVG